LLFVVLLLPVCFWAQKSFQPEGMKKYRSASSLILWLLLCGDNKSTAKITVEVIDTYQHYSQKVLLTAHKQLRITKPNANSKVILLALSLLRPIFGLS